MDIKEVKELVDLMKRSDLTELEIEKEGMRVKISRGRAGQVNATTNFLPPEALPQGGGQETKQIPAPASSAPADDGVYIKSPMVGTFYRSPSPDSAVYVDADSKVNEKTVVCIIEAMKVMNEIQAEVKGVILEVLVENGQPVEFGQPLFKIKPA
ncbi:MAG: acetyl-CoA carboxylase biotin carboxyl carrier protein [Opitutales bacterium]|nr:acetyl-CoA carboxylase biotin carboxyl carrier protein [Opitutales bacterium]